MRCTSERREEQKVNECHQDKEHKREKKRVLSILQEMSHKNEPWKMLSERGEDSSIYIYFSRTGTDG